MVQEDNIDVHVGGFLSNICLACMPVWEDAKIVNMISVCLDTTLTTSQCNRYSFRVHDYAPAQAVAFAPMLAKMGKKWHIAYADYSWGQSTRDAYAAEIKKNGGEVVGTTGIPLGTADMTPFLSKISGDFDGLFGIFFGKDGVTDRQPGLRSRPDQEVQMGRRRRDLQVDQPAGARQQDRRLHRHQPLHPGVPGPARYAVPPQVLRRRQGAAGQGRSVRPAARPLRAVELRSDERLEDRHGRIRSSRAATTRQKLIEALEGLEMKEGDDFPQGDKTLRKDDHQAFLREFLFEVKDGNYKLLETVAKDKTIVPPACTFSA